MRYHLHHANLPLAPQVRKGNWAAAWMIEEEA